MILCDKTIRFYCVNSGRHGSDFKPMISPFSEGVQGDNIISYGLSSGGYDMRLGNEVWIFKNTSGEVVDPKRFKKDKEYVARLFDIKQVPNHEPVVIPAHGYILGTSLEYFHIPDMFEGQVFGKSTYARCGLIVNVTPLEPGWEGNLTIEIANTNPCPAMVYVGEGIGQVIFHTLDERPERDYASKGGKYQKQIGVTPPKVL